MDNVPPKKSSKPRPKGTDADLARYKGSEEWSYRRWAWEFLRRNPKFVEACNTVQPDDVAQQQAIAAEFKLKHFRDYRLGFRNGKASSPRFLPADVSFWTFTGTHRVYKPGVGLRDGQVLVRFDLSEATLDAGALDAQVRKASKVLERELNGYLAAQGWKPPKGHKPRKRDFLKLLRLLDILDAAGPSASPTVEVSALRVVFRNLSKGWTDTDVRRSLGHHVKRARAYSESDYVFVAASADKKTPKKR